MLQVSGIILAAGSATRFGSDKLCAELPDQTMMLVAVANSMKSVLPKVIAVVAPEQTKRAKQFESLGVTVHICKQAHQGMGASLAYAISCSADSDAWLIALADMPYIQVQTIQQIYQVMLEGNTLAAPFYQNHRGHPVAFCKRFKTELENLAGDQGAKVIVDQHINELVRINTNDPGVLKDIDYPSDILF